MSKQPTRQTLREQADKTRQCALAKLKQKDVNGYIRLSKEALKLEDHLTQTYTLTSIG